MSRIAQPRAIATAIALVAGVLLPATAHAHGPEDCTELAPARLGGPDVLHVWDPHGDTDELLGAGGGTIYPTQADIIGAWVSGPSAWADRDSSELFRANIQVENLSSHPVNLLYYFHYLGPQGQERFVVARAEMDSQWWFGYGSADHSLPITRNVLEGATTGTVDTNKGMISIPLPAETLPSRPADGASLAWQAADVETRIHLGLPKHVEGPLPTQGLNWLVDYITGSICQALLYEQPPPELA